MLLDAKNVSKAFGSFWAVSGADLTVDEGEIIGLIGPNGAGKSTFFNCLAGDTLPTSGRIVFNGEEACRARLIPAENQQQFACSATLHHPFRRRRQLPATQTCSRTRPPVRSEYRRKSPRVRARSPVKSENRRSYPRVRQSKNHCQEVTRKHPGKLARQR